MKSFKSYLKETSDARKAKKEANNKRNLKIRLKSVQNGGYSGVKGDTEESLKRKIDLARHGVELYGGSVEEGFFKDKILPLGLAGSMALGMPGTISSNTRGNETSHDTGTHVTSPVDNPRSTTIGSGQKSISKITRRDRTSSIPGVVSSESLPPTTTVNSTNNFKISSPENNAVMQRNISIRSLKVGSHDPVVSKTRNSSYTNSDKIPNFTGPVNVDASGGRTERNSWTGKRETSVSATGKNLAAIVEPTVKLTRRRRSV